ncbi:meiotic nuclear division protein 1 [Pterulicium gracile]|uniref:Meiotic nuclear division protein 1 n=1 Tax=Pterulicium gracile TaxID=1884261 RepID=A0A5C3QTX1_9AGAR|nr:meiotic nuclear division protein 1 [Pterula gracilis]
MAPRGLSAEEKRVKLLEIFHETKDFFQLKELEKMAPKMKGIVSQTVKDVLQGLVDDGLVCAEKIGASNFYWSFPSQNGSMMQARLSTLQEAKNNTEQQMREVREEIEAEKGMRVESPERTAALQQLLQEKESLAKLDQELRNYAACDPAKVAEKRAAVELAREAAIRWTDNFGIAFSHLLKQMNVSSSDLREYFGVEETYEDIY